MIVREYEKAPIVFHYNKKHNENPLIPPYVLKVKGDTFYVNHIDSQIGFSTKETPDNPHTKGSIKFNGQLTITEEEGIIIGMIK